MKKGKELRKTHLKVTDNTKVIIRKKRDGGGRKKTKGR